MKARTPYRVAAPPGSPASRAWLGRLPPRRSSYQGNTGDIFLVLRVAQAIEPNQRQLLAWYRDTRIVELGDLTAEELLRQGRGSEVMGFLKDILSGTRN